MTNTYVALLRGINVGGKAKVEMSKLKSVFIGLGCQNVSTYINSGNVIFQDKRSPKILEDKISTAILKEFKLEVPVILRNFENINKVVKGVPASWTNDSKFKTDVLFLWSKINKANIIKSFVINPKIENVMYIDGAVIWNIGRQNVTRGGGIKLIKSSDYQFMTSRNINTVRELCELMRLTDSN